MEVVATMHSGEDVSLTHDFMMGLVRQMATPEGRRVKEALNEITKSVTGTHELLRFLHGLLDSASSSSSSSSSAASSSSKTKHPTSLAATVDLRSVIALCWQVVAKNTHTQDTMPLGVLGDSALRLAYTEPRLDSDVRRKLGDLVPHVFERDYSFGRRWWPKVVEMTLHQDKWYTTTTAASSTTFADGATRQQRHTELEEITIGLLAELLPIAFYQVGRAMLDTQITPTLLSALAADKPPKVSLAIILLVVVVVVDL